MKKQLLLCVLALLMLFSACAVTPPSDVTDERNSVTETVVSSSDIAKESTNHPVLPLDLEHEYGKPPEMVSAWFRYALPIAETDVFLFFASPQGIQKQDKNTGKTQLFLEDSDVFGLFLADGWLYYYASRENLLMLNRTPVTQAAPQTVVSMETVGRAAFGDQYDDLQYYDPFRIGCDYQVVGDSVYFASVMECVLYRMDTKEATVVSLDFGGEWAVSSDGVIYYIPHASREFSVYAIDPRLNGDPQLLLVSGVDSENINNSVRLYKSLAVADDGLYAMQTLPGAILRRSGDIWETVAEGEFEQIFSANGRLYGVCKEKENYYLCCLNDPNLSGMRMELPDFRSSFQAFLCNGACYYVKQSEEIPLRYEHRLAWKSE